MCLELQYWAGQGQEDPGSSLASQPGTERDPVQGDNAERRVLPWSSVYACVHTPHMCAYTQVGQREAYEPPQDSLMNRY